MIIIRKAPSGLTLTAFTTGAQKLIRTTHVDNNVASQLRIPRVSDYAFASNLYVDHSSSPYKCEWILLRTPADSGGSSTYGRYIVTMTKYGKVSTGANVDSDRTGFLPVISAYIGN